MRIVSTLCRTGLFACGGLLVLSAMGGTALADDIHFPEIDPTTISSAATLFFGTVMLLTGRRGFKK